MSRFAPRETAESVDRLGRRLEGAIKQWGPPIEVLLPSAGDVAAVDHGLGAIPDGVIVVLAVGGHVQAANVSRWTTTRAELVADAANTRARVIFVTFREAVTYA